MKHWPRANVLWALSLYRQQRMREMAEKEKEEEVEQQGFLPMEEGARQLME
jgi:hypothetical protein